MDKVIDKKKEEEAKNLSEMNEAEVKELFAGLISEGVEKNLSDAINDRFAEAMKEFGFTKENLEKGKFPGLPGADGAELGKKEKSALFLKAVFSRDTEFFGKLYNAREKGMLSNLGSSGGFLVPEDFFAEIQRIASDHGYIRKFARRLPMRSDTLPVPVEGASVTANWVGQAKTATASQPVLEQAILKANKLVGLTTMASELLEDADVDVISYLMEIFAEEFANQEDDQGFNGVGTPFTGILQQDDVLEVVMSSGNTTFDDVTLADLIDMRAQPKASVIASSAYFMHRTVWAVIQKLQQGSQDILSFQNPQVLANGPQGIKPLSPVGFIQGWPVYASDNLPSTTDTAVSTPFLIFGSLQRGVLIGQRREMTMSISTEATVASESMFETDQQAVKLTERVALVISLPAALVRLVTAAS